MAADQHDHISTGCDRCHRAYQLTRCINRLAIQCHHHIAGLDARLRRRPRAIHRRDRHPRHMPLGRIGRDEIGHAHPQPTALHPSLAAQLRGDPGGDQRGHRKANAHRAGTIRRDDGGVHPHHLPIGIEQRPTGIARIDRRVDLQIVVKCRGPDIAPARGDNPRRHRATQAKRIARRQHPIAHFHQRTVAPFHRWQWMWRIDLDDGDIGQLIRTDQLCGQAGAVGERDGDLIRLPHHMIVGDDGAVGIDDETGTSALHLLRIAAQTVAQLTADFRRHACQWVRPAHRLGDTDIDHRWQHAFDDRRETVHPRPRRRGKQGGGGQGGKLAARHRAHRGTPGLG